MRHLRDTPGGLEGAVDLEEAGVPEGVRAVTSRRIRRLPSSAREAVEVASVIGREFDFGLLEALGPLSGRRPRRRARRGGARPRAARGRRPRRPLRLRPRAGPRDALRRPLRACAARGCTRASARRSSPATRTTSTPGCRSSRATSRAPPRSRARRARSTSRSPPAAAPTACWPGRRRPPTTAARCARARPRAAGDRTAGELLLALGRVGGAGRARAGARDVRRGRRARARARRPRPARARCARRRGAVVDARARGPRRSSRCSRRRCRGWARRTRRCARACWRGSRSSSTTRASPSGGCC